mmetsp:Transcript_19435/g.28248  ORF Transcript_19435/g.28248 Transcript_19435/m.28248 type:complete len:507 (-) Transcript_19435:178-1698(-)
MSSPHDSVEKHGQGSLERFDPCFTAPVCYSLGLLCAGVGVGMIIYTSAFQTSNVVPSSVGAYVGFSILIFFGVIFLSFANYRVRFRLRSGRWGQYPSTKEAIIEAFTENEASLVPNVAGEGWSYLIARDRPMSPPLVALRGNWSGLVKRVGERGFRVRTGTLLGELTGIMEKHDLALYDRPQFDQMTIAGAVRTCGHGWNASAWLIDSVMACEAVEKGSGRIVKRHQGDKDFLSVLLGEQFVLLEVDIEGQPNRNLFIETKRFPSPDKVGVQDSSGCTITCCCKGKDDGDQLDLERWRKAPYKMIFVYKSSILTKTGTFSNDPKEANVGNCALRLRYLQRQAGLSGDWSIVDSIADAHTIVQNVWPTETVLSHLFRRDLNTEIYSTDKFDLKASLMPLTIFHRKRGGRTEIRVREVEGKIMFAIDGTMNVSRRTGTIRERTPSAYIEWFKILHSLGVTTGAIHRGKYIPPSLGPIEEVSMKDLFSSANFGLPDSTNDVFIENEYDA